MLPVGSSPRGEAGGAKPLVGSLVGFTTQKLTIFYKTRTLFCFEKCMIWQKINLNYHNKIIISLSRITQ